MAKKEKIDFPVLFRALGDPTRLRIVQFLRARDAGLENSADGALHLMCPTVGEVCASVTGAKKITSKVSHHLKELRVAGLITIERRGKNMICGLNRDAIDAMIACLETAEDFKRERAEAGKDVELRVEAA